MRRDVVPEWLKQQTPELVEALRLRRQHLGPHDADPFLAYLYTDDFAKWFVGPWLAALGTQAWRRILNDANIWVSAKVGFGTIIHSHGGRFVLNAGYTCLTPNKLARGIDTACTALSAGITRDELEANNSFLVHVHDIANLSAQDTQRSVGTAQSTRCGHRLRTSHGARVASPARVLRECRRTASHARLRILPLRRH